MKDPETKYDKVFNTLAIVFFVGIVFIFILALVYGTRTQ